MLKTVMQWELAHIFCLKSAFYGIDIHQRVLPKTPKHHTQSFKTLLNIFTRSSQILSVLHYYIIDTGRIFIVENSSSAKCVCTINSAEVNWFVLALNPLL